MSSNYRMNVIWASQGAQLQRDMQMIMGGLGQMERGVGRNRQQMGMWGQQMRAIGTTIRYAFAGALVYSIATAVNSLGTFEEKLGQVDALAGKFTSSGKFQGLGDELDRLGTSALQTSSKYGIAIETVQSFQQAFVSAGFDEKLRKNRKEIEAFADGMSQLTAASGEVGDPLVLASALTALIRGSGQRPSQVTKKYASELFEVLRQSPVLYGQDISRDLGRLLGARGAARMSVEQVLGVYSLASARGGSPSVIGRGVTQLLQASLINPKSKAAKSAFEQVVGTSDPNALRAMGGFAVLSKILRAGMRLNIGDKTALGSDAFGTPQEAIQAAGIKGRGGIDVTLLSKLFTRQESTRQVLNLISVLQQEGPDALQRFVRELKTAGEQERITAEANAANSRRYWQRLRTEQQNFGISIARGLAPVISEIERHVTGPVSRFAVRHPTAALGIVAGGGAASIAAKLGLAGALTGRLPGRLGRILGGRFAGGAGSALLASEVGAGLGGFTATGMPTGIPGQGGAGSRGNPFWVVIDPFSWFLPGAPSGTGGPGGGATTGGGGLTGFLKKKLGWAAAGGAVAGRFAARPGVLRAARLGGLPITAAMALAFPESVGAEAAGTGAASPSDVGYFDPRRDPFVARLMRNMPRRHSRGTMQMLDRFSTGEISAGHFERWLRIMALRNAQGRGMPVDIDGAAVLKVEIGMTDEVRKLLKISAPGSLPVSLWSKGHPQHRGKNKQQRNRVADKPRG